MTDSDQTNRDDQPPGSDHKQRPDKEKKPPMRFSFFWVMMVLLAVLIMGQFFTGKPDGPTNQEFKRWVEEGRLGDPHVFSR